jgi:predicted Ser/Thr protein kinase
VPSKPLEPGDPSHLGRFELLGRLGEGGQGIVYLGRGSGPGEERVAVKVLRSSADAMTLERLARELDAIHQVQPFVTAGVIEASEDQGRRFVVSEFIDGPSLQDRVDASGPLPEGDLQRLAVGTATALTAIHGAGVVHRDFKPANVLLGPDGPRVVDFGIARLIDAATITSGVIGTPSYIAPEQLAGARPTSAVDIFAWAVTMVFAATGRSAFGADSVPAVMNRILNGSPDLAGVPASMLPIISECLAKDPAQRPKARDLLLSLVDPSAPWHPPTQLNAPAPAATGPMLPSAAVEPTGPATPVRSRKRAAAVAGGGVAVAAVAAIAVLLATQGSGAPPKPHHSAAASSAPATATVPATAAGGTIPAAFAGTWSGTAHQAVIGMSNVSLPNHLTLTLAAGGTTAHEVDDSCVNTLTLSQGATTRNGTTLTFSEPQTSACVAGTVTLTRQGTGLAYRWTDHVEQNTGTLSHH